MANTVLAFSDTKRNFAEFVNYQGPLSFEEWCNLNQDQKAALLFVQFYNEITLAWAKATNGYEFITGEEGVSTMCQYITKNIPIIEKYPKRFSAANMYRVAYNCLYCICHDRKCDKERFENETSAIIVKDGDEYNLLDTMADKNGTPEDAINKANFEKEFWAVIRSIGDEAEKVLRYLASGDAKDLKKLNPRAKNYKSDPLRDVEVTPTRASEIIEQLKERFMSLSSNSSCGSYIASFACLA